MKKEVFYGFGYSPAERKYTLISYNGQVFRFGKYDFGWDSEKKNCIELSTGYAVCNDKTMKLSISFIINNYSLINDRIAKMEQVINNFNNLLKENMKLQPKAEQVIYTAMKVK